MDIRFQDYRKEDIEQNLRREGMRPLDVMVTGVTGAGKSTTLNSFFKRTVAKVGRGVDPETMDLDAYELNDAFRIWDTPGLGDGKEKDKMHKQKLIDLLHKTYEYNGDEYAFIDMVIVIVEGSNRDLGTTYTLLNDVLIPHIQKKRILVIINQADMAMKGRYWDCKANIPEQQLLDFLDAQAVSIENRVREATGVCIHRPVYYSAEYGYNVKAVYDFIIDNMPSRRRRLKR